MKWKQKLRYFFYKNFPERYIKFFNRSYDHKLNHNLLEIIKKGLKIDVVFDIGAYRGEWSKLLSKTSLKNFQINVVSQTGARFLQFYIPVPQPEK